MKVKHLLGYLSDLDENDDVCALVWDKGSFDYCEDEDVELTTDAWSLVTRVFDETPFPSVYSWIMDYVVEVATPRQDSPNALSIV